MISIQPHFNSPCVIRIPLVKQCQTPTKDEDFKAVINTHIHSRDSTHDNTKEQIPQSQMTVSVVQTKAQTL